MAIELQSPHRPPGRVGAPDDALALLRATAVETDPGYVHLQPAAYRAHHLLARAVLAHSRPGDAVFEAGVSSGYFASVLVRAGRTVDGHEIDELAAERARRVCDRVLVGDLQHLDPADLPRRYQVLLFGDTLEHVPDPAAVLRRLATRLTPDGVVVVSVPNVANWSVRARLLAGRFDYTDRGILDRTHLRFFTRATLVAMLEGAGFEVLELAASVPVPGVTGERLGRLTHRVGNAVPGLFGYGFVVVARPVVDPAP